MKKFFKTVTDVIVSVKEAIGELINGCADFCTDYKEWCIEKGIIGLIIYWMTFWYIGFTIGQKIVWWVVKLATNKGAVLVFPEENR